MKYIYLNGKEKDKPELIVFRVSDENKKTDMVNKLRELGYDHHETSHFFEKHNVEHSSSRIQQAKQETFKNVVNSLANGRNVIVSEDFIKLEDFKDYIELSNRLNININVVNHLEKNDLTRVPRINEQKIGQENFTLLSGQNMLVNTLKQHRLDTGRNIPRRLIEDSMNKLEAAVSFTAVKLMNSKFGSQENQVLMFDYVSTKEVFGMFNCGLVDEGLKKIKEASEFTKGYLMPQEFVKLLRKDENIKNDIKNVLVDYFVGASEGNKNDEELSLKIYKNIYQLGQEKKNESRRTLRM